MGAFTVTVTVALATYPCASATTYGRAGVVPVHPEIGVKTSEPDGPSRANVPFPEIVTLVALHVPGDGVGD